MRIKSKYSFPLQQENYWGNSRLQGVCKQYNSTFFVKEAMNLYLVSPFLTKGMPKVSFLPCSRFLYAYSIHIIKKEHLLILIL